MRKHDIDNIRWMTVVLVVIYHVIYMYSGVIPVGVIGPFSSVQYQDAFQYLVYPWFMIILFIVSGISARCYLETHTAWDFVKSRTRKLLVPSTIGLFVFWWILGYFSMAISKAFETLPGEVPGIVHYLIMVLSGQGVLWFIQMLWLFSMGLVWMRRWEKGRLFSLCEKVNLPVLLALGIPVWGAAQVLNTPVIAVYRFGIYGVSFLLGYFVFAHETVMEKLSRYWHVLAVLAVVLGICYVWYYFGENYAIAPVVNSPFSIAYGWVAVLAVFAIMKRWMDISTPFTAWMTQKSFGLYVFHYLPLAACAYLLDRYANAGPAVSYLATGMISFTGAYLLYEIISRIPVLRWCVLGINKKQKQRNKIKTGK